MITMRINTETQLSLALKLGEAMEKQSKWALDGKTWLVKRFRPIEGTKQITVYLEEL